MQLDQSSVPIRRRRAPGEGRTVRLTHTQHSSQTHVSCCRPCLYQPVCLRSSHLENIPCVVAADGSSIQCQDASCPFKEEQHRIALSIYIYSYSRLEEYTETFYLRDIGKRLCFSDRTIMANMFVFEYSDISQLWERGYLFRTDISSPPPPHPSSSSPCSVRPENLQNLQITDGKEFSWSYPDSWEKPCSFFSLQFQVKVVHNDDTCHSDRHIRVITTSASSYTSL